MILTADNTPLIFLLSSSLKNPAEPIKEPTRTRHHSELIVSCKFLNALYALSSSRFSHTPNAKASSGHHKSTHPPISRPSLNSLIPKLAYDPNHNASPFNTKKARIPTRSARMPLYRAMPRPCRAFCAHASESVSYTHLRAHET